MSSPADTPVFVLCGGLGTRFREMTELRPKPMIPIGGHPILWHIMNKYAAHGFKRFVLCTGYMSEVIKAYFHDYAAMNSDFTVDLRSNKRVVHSIDHEQDWSVTVAYTGEHTMTGGRVAIAARKYLGDAGHFAVTYGDGLTDVDLAAEFAFHLKEGRTGTVLGVNPPSRFGELELDGNRVVAFSEKPEFTDTWINGGFFFFKREFLGYLPDGEAGSVLERAPLVKLAQDGELSMWKHSGFWQCMDTQRDHDQLTELWNTGEAPWLR
ncbi:MAG: glucose-1-phosphate cytidylyltransferase [Myxococcales bacterium]|nr:glucose-1-phosphate cytidylyltransferase [Myxococcales bacterium]